MHTFLVNRIAPAVIMFIYVLAVAAFERDAFCDDGASSRRHRRILGSGWFESSESAIEHPDVADV